MKSEYNRLTSLYAREHLLDALPYSPAEMAEAGLYWNGIQFRCAFCPATFSADDECLFENPAREHVRQFPRCRLMKRPDNCVNVPLQAHRFHPLVDDDPRLEAVRLRSLCSTTLSARDRECLAKGGLYSDPLSKTKIRCAFCSFSRDEGVFERHSAESDGCPLLRTQWYDREAGFVQTFENVPMILTEQSCIPKHPEMEEWSQRYLSFVQRSNPWPHETLEGVELAQNGFYYRKVSDVVTCYWCDVTLGQWEPDDVPRFEHFQKNRMCRLALSKISPDERKALTLEKNIVREPVAMEPTRRSNATCVMCLENDRNVVFLNCRHCVSCQTCSVRIDDCPVCRKPIFEKMKIYL